MEGYSRDTYGRSFADVYDDWYGDVSDAAAIVEVVRGVAAGGTVVEMGVGTGRIALALAAAGLTVHGLDASPEMLARLVANRPTASSPTAVRGGHDRAALPPGTRRRRVVRVQHPPESLDLDDQRLAVTAAAELLGPDGLVVVEAFVPGDLGDTPDGDVSVRAVATDRVELHVTRTDPGPRTIAGQIVELTEAGGVRLRPWALRATTPDELDEMAADAGLELVDRTGNTSLYRR